MGKIKQEIENVSQRLDAYRAELVDRIRWAMPQDGLSQPLKGVYLARISFPTEKIHSVLVPSLCVIAQGTKIVFMGESHYQYDSAHYLLATLELPRVSQVLEASKQYPYLSFRLELDPHLVESVLVEVGHTVSSGHSEVRAIHVSPLDIELLDAVVRMVRLINYPDDARVLMPLIIKEIIYRLLVSQHGERLLYLTLAKSHTPTITKAIERLRQNFDQPIHMETLAHELGMSVSSFHHHFKAVTAMTPLQFQKRLRLQEARRLLLYGKDMDATRVAHQVGYSDATHFSREYKSLFGNPPMRDIKRLRAIPSHVLSDSES